MAFSITRRLDRLERAQPRAGSYLLARNDGETLIKLAASPPVVSFDGGPVYRFKIVYNRFGRSERSTG